MKMKTASQFIVFFFPFLLLVSFYIHLTGRFNKCLNIRWLLAATSNTVVLAVVQLNMSLLFYNHGLISEGFCSWWSFELLHDDVGITCAQKSRRPPFLTLCVSD